MGISPRQYLAARKFGNFKDSRAQRRIGDDFALRVGIQLQQPSLRTRFGRTRHDARDLQSRRSRSEHQLHDCRFIDWDACSLLSPNVACVLCRMADNDAELEKDLREEFPHAQIKRDDSALREPVQKILNHLDKNEPRLDLPLDIRATAFQRQVWEKLRAIPYGQTVSYGEVAKALGKPGAVRAVGRACATNPVALVIPCHRVVREDQSLGGYRWGLERKKKLLEHEASAERLSRGPFSGRFAR